MSTTGIAEPARRGWRAGFDAHPWLVPISLAGATGLVYLLLGPIEGQGVYVPLADAFLHGRLHLLEDRPWLELVPRPEGGQFVPLPPAPALTLIPVVAVLQLFSAPELSPNIPAAVVGALNVLLAWWLLAGWGVAEQPRTWLTIGFAGATHFWVAAMGGPHHYAQLCGVLFTLVALNLAVRRRRPVLAGLALGLSAASRLPMGLALPVFIGLYASGWRPNRSHLTFALGLAVPALLVAAYNVARFGSPFDFGYTRIPSGDQGLLVTDEPWFRDGLLSFTYIPRHLWAMFLAGFHFDLGTPPFIKPSWSATSLLLTAPFLFWSVLARGRWVDLLWIGILWVMLPNVIHGSWGFAQFGYRFILDAMPLLLLLLGSAFRERIGTWPIVAILVGIAVNAYGIFVITVLDFVG
jgi:hypothetical protein